MVTPLFEGWSPPVRCVAFDGRVLEAPHSSGNGDTRGFKGVVSSVFGGRRVRPMGPEAVTVIRALAGLELAVTVAYGDGSCDEHEGRLCAAGVRELLSTVYTDPRDLAEPGRAFFTTVARASGREMDQVCYVSDRVACVRPALPEGMRAVLVAPADLVPVVPAEVPVIGHVRELPALLARTAGTTR